MYTCIPYWAIHIAKFVLVGEVKPMFTLKNQSFKKKYELLVVCDYLFGLNTASPNL